MQNATHVAVDWGTSSFRLWLIDAAGAVLAESRGAEGMLVAAKSGFPEILAKHLQAVSAPAGLPVIICGMAGARGGWVEAGYIDTPAPLSAIVGGARRIERQDRDIRILPGLAVRSAANPDVIRGEETQLVGASADFSGQSGLACMPGTHSKWVTVADGTVTGFQTYMTGELFDVISKHSILAQAIAGADASTASPDVFAQAVRDMVAQPGQLTHRLFGARSGQILHGRSAADSAAYLSGTLIGAEIAGATGFLSGDAEITLVATGRLQALYESAFAAVSLACRTVDADQAVLRGLNLAAKSLWP